MSASLRIAFVSSHPSIRRFKRDASFIYRCENLALALAATGHQVKLLHITTLLVRKDFDIVVFLRPAYSWLFCHVVSSLRKRGTILIADVDDLIFDPQFASYRPSVMNGTADQAETRKKFIQHGSALEKLDKVQFSTTELAQYYLAIRSSVQHCVIPNAPHRSWSDIALPCQIEERRISYFSGTRTHDRDFAIVEPILEDLLKIYEDLVVQIVGPVSVGLDHPRVRKIQKVAFSDYAELVRTSYLCIAPLEDTPFNRCKSALKAFEASAMNVPTVASPVGEYAQVNVEGVLQASTPNEWWNQLTLALEPSNYVRLSTGLRERMQAYTDTAVSATKFLEFAKS